MNSDDKAVVIVVISLVSFFILLACIMTYQNYLDHTFTQKAMEGGYEQIWDKEGMRVLWKKSNPSIP